mgnify:CR=1 FL=1
MTYKEFLETKIELATESGFVVDPEKVNKVLKPHQRDAVVWALRGGRRALFESFGLVTINGTDYQIVDIGLRMLEPRELYGCQGFPDDYIIDHDYTGKTYPRSEQVRRCGNAVCPPIPAALVRANLPELCVAKRTPNMKIESEQTGQLRFA